MTRRRVRRVKCALQDHMLVLGRRHALNVLLEKLIWTPTRIPRVTSAVLDSTVGHGQRGVPLAQRDKVIMIRRHRPHAESVSVVNLQRRGLSRVNIAHLGRQIETELHRLRVSNVKAVFTHQV